jgi:hypothetical protein
VSGSYAHIDTDLTTRDGEVITITTAAFTAEGVAEVAIEVPHGPSEVRSVATVVTATQARQLADAFDKLARHWGE